MPAALDSVVVVAADSAAGASPARVAESAAAVATDAVAVEVLPLQCSAVNPYKPKTLNTKHSTRSFAGVNRDQFFVSCSCCVCCNSAKDL